MIILPRHSFIDSCICRGGTTGTNFDGGNRKKHKYTGCAFAKILIRKRITKLYDKISIIRLNPLPTTLIIGARMKLMYIYVPGVRGKLFAYVAASAWLTDGL